jgi:hypothetical protein
MRWLVEKEKLEGGIVLEKSKPSGFEAITGHTVGGLKALHPHS